MCRRWAAQYGFGSSAGAFEDEEGEMVPECGLVVNGGGEERVPDASEPSLSQVSG